MSENKNNEIISRREFFKGAAKKALPIIGAVALMNVPIITKAAEATTKSGCNVGCTMGCTGGCLGCTGQCTGGCTGGCLGYCTSCTGSCDGGCSGGCTGCKGGSSSPAW